MMSIQRRSFISVIHILISITWKAVMLFAENHFVVDLWMGRLVSFTTSKLIYFWIIQIKNIIALLLYWKYTVTTNDSFVFNIKFC